MSDKPVALITGANRGIGLQIAKDLASHGFTVLVGARNLVRGESAAASIDGDAHGLQLDVTDQASIDAAVARVRREFGRLDVLVNNAGIMNAGRPGETLEQQLQAGRLGRVSLAAHQNRKPPHRTPTSDQ
jgi:NAD(P)-dependent dehydrogenase (short-subunit alcohol dehydrogenase family)